MAAFVPVSDYYLLVQSDRQHALFACLLSLPVLLSVFKLSACVYAIYGYRSVWLTWAVRVRSGLQREKLFISPSYGYASPRTAARSASHHCRDSVLPSDGPYSFWMLRMVWKGRWSIQRGRVGRRLWTVYREQKLLRQRKVFSMIHRLTRPRPSPQSALAVSW